MTALKNLFKKIPGLHRLFIKWVDLREKQLVKDKSAEDVFTEIYKHNRWRSQESVSGPGSAIDQTEAVLESLPILLKELSIGTMLDIPSGDFNWLKNVRFENVEYLGADIVRDIVDNNLREYQTETITFRQINLLSDQIPKVDLILCRDCLVHFSFDDIEKALSNIRRSGSKFLLTTSFVRHLDNHDIVTGQWRPLNLQAAPFRLGQPIETINEKCTEGGGIYEDKSLCLWRIKDIVDS